MNNGELREHTLDWVTKRAIQSGVSLDKLGIDPDLDEYLDEDGATRPGVTLPDNLFIITILYDNSLDETFCILGDYGVNIADWIAEDCENEATDGEYWKVILSAYSQEPGEGETQYWVDSYGKTGP
jgi:hypothetical protein